jgi:hypothetical protein
MAFLEPEAATVRTARRLSTWSVATKPPLKAVKAFLRHSNAVLAINLRFCEVLARAGRCTSHSTAAIGRPA